MLCASHTRGALKLNLHHAPSFVKLAAPRSKYVSTAASSADGAEVAHFNKLAATWWDPHGSSRLLHQMNPYRHRFIKTCFSSFPSERGQKRYLDIGCGGGIFTESAARLQDTSAVVGIDPSKEGIEVARKHAQLDHVLCQNGRLTYENKTIEELPIPSMRNEQFDVVSLFEVIEHINYPSRFLETCMPFVKPGGWLIMSTIARTWMSWLTTKLVAEDVVGLVPRGTHDWDKYINVDELQKWFAGKASWGAGGGMRVMGIVFVPGLGWKVVHGGQRFGNYFFGVRKNV